MKPSVVDKYKTACASIGLAPNSNLLRGLEKRCLYVRVEKIQPEYWKPVIKIIENDSSLVEIVLEYSVSFNQAYVKKSVRPSFNLTTKNMLFKSISSCLMCSSVLQKLSIINIPLKKSQIELLVRGISRNQSLSYLSLNSSILGHKAFNEIFPVIRKSLNITHLDFTKCKLSLESCSLIGSLLRSQILERHTETWKHTLRYNNPDIATVTGLKRITLNGNPIGDEGCEMISTALQDDYWIKAIDLQQCNISDDGAKSLLVILEDNASMCVLDIRSNPDIKDVGLLRKIDDCLERNKTHCTEEFNVGDMLNKSKAAKPKSNPRRSISKISKRNSLNESRTPKKLSQYESHYNSMMKQSVVKNIESLNDISLKDEKNKFSPILIHRTPSPSKQIHSSKKLEEEMKIFQMLDELKNDLEVYKNELHTEKEKTLALEARIKELERENQYLKNQDQSKVEDLEPELLETIETSFSQFHNFLDMLKQAGYGDLCQLVKK